MLHKKQTHISDVLTHTHVCLYIHIDIHTFFLKGMYFKERYQDGTKKRNNNRIEQKAAYNTLLRNPYTGSNYLLSYTFTPKVQFS